MVVKWMGMGEGR